MYVITWQYYVKQEYVAEFEKIYGEYGHWANLLQKGRGYLGTELLRDSNKLRHYLTIDRWESVKDYEAFLSTWREEYERLDAQCQGLTEQENLLGKWATILHKTR